MTSDTPETLGASRRSFMKAGAAAAGAGAMGWFSFQAITDDEGTVLAQDGGDLALVFAWQFQPGVDFELVTEIDDSEEILGERDDGVDAVANPEDWDGFVIRYRFSEVPYYGIGFFGEDVGVNEGDRFNFSPNASLTSQELSLVQTRAVAAGDEEETPTEEEGTPTEEETTTEEATPEEGTPTEGTPTEAGNETGEGPTPVEGTPVVTGNETGGGTPTPGG